jgi:N-acetylglucosamine kinase-like BadF-type ATPase
MAEAGLIAGFDAGQTHTTCRLAASRSGAAAPEPLAEGVGPGVSHLAAEGGAERFQAALRLSLAETRARLGAPWATAPLQAAAVGASGIEQGSAVQQRAMALAAGALGLEPTRLMVSGDERTALRGAFPQDAGIVVISGTGTIAVGRDGRGREHRCAGWGWLLDGAGSAMDIGRDGLALSVQMADGRLRETALREQLWQALGASSAQDVKAAVVAPDFGAAGFARLAPVVDQQALHGDAEAQIVIRRSAEALAVMVHTIAEQLDLRAPAVCGVGGALAHLRSLQRAFSDALQQHLPGAQQQAPSGDACAGALNLAAQAALRC